jgi:intracellular sulfur oxidation DsrE/DsrF family protein
MKTSFSPFLVGLIFGLLWLSSPAALGEKYKPLKVVYDVSVENTDGLENVLARASHLSKLTGADPMEGSIVIVLRGPEVAFFTKDNYDAYKDHVDRAKSLTVGGTVRIMMSDLALKVRGLSADDVPKFIKVVPFGDAEIARLQTEGKHAYIRVDRSLAP